MLTDVCALQLWPLTSHSIGRNVGVLAISGHCAVSPIVSRCCCCEQFLLKGLSESQVRAAEWNLRVKSKSKPVQADSHLWQMRVERQTSVPPWSWETGESVVFVSNSSDQLNKLSVHSVTALSLLTVYSSISLSFSASLPHISVYHSLSLFISLFLTFLSSFPLLANVFSLSPFVVNSHYTLSIGGPSFALQWRHEVAVPPGGRLPSRQRFDRANPTVIVP